MPPETPEATEEVEVSPSGVTIPAGWAKLAVTVLIGMLLGGAGTGVGSGLLVPSDPTQHTSEAELSAAVTDVLAADADAREGLARQSEVEDVLWIVCELASRAEPPITNRRCQSQ